MPLVPLTTVQRWYQRDSWVYKGFSYWFKNPLWNTQVPKGFSLCPYFWFSILSVLLRVLVGAVTLVRFAAKPFGGVLTYTDRFFSFFVPRLKKEVKGIATTVGTFITLIVVGIAWIIAIKWMELHAVYANAGVAYALYLPLLLLGVAAPCWIYAEVNTSWNRCKVENYVRLASVITLALGVYWCDAATLFAPLWEIPKAAGSLLWEFGVWMWGGIWWLLLSIPHWGMSVLRGVGSTLLPMLWSFIWGAISLVIIGAFGLLIDKYYVKTPVRLVDKEIDNRANDILEIFAHTAYMSDRHNNSESRDRKFWDRYLRFVPEALALAYDIARRSGEPTPKDIERASAAALETFKLEIAEKEKRRIARTQACNSVSSKLDKLFKWFDWIPKAILGIGRAILVVIAGICWVFVQIWTFVCLIWELVKAKKSGACPYLKFEDPKTPSIVVNGKKLA